MKKVLLLTLVISMLISSSAFAGVTIEHTFKGEDGFIYHFGTITDLDNPFDAGIKIGDRFFSLNKEDVKDGTNALTKALSEQGKGKFGIGLKDESNILGNTYDVIPYSKADENAQEEYYTAKTVTKSDVSEFPEGEPASSDASIKSLKINGEDADAVSGTTYYVAVADLDDYEGQITATATDANATVEVSPIADNQATVTVTAEDGVTTGEYTVKFKEMVKKELPFISKKDGDKVIDYLRLINGTTWEAGTVNSANFYARWIDTEIRAVYFDYSTADLSENDRIVRTATISGTANRTSIYNFYDSSYSTITDECRFDEFTNGSARLLGYHQRTVQNKDANISISFKSSLLRIKEGNFIKIALQDGANDDGGISQFADIPTLTINYITLD